MSRSSPKSNSRFLSLRATQENPIDGCIKQHRETGIYYVRKEKKGKGRLFESLETTKLSVARELAEERVTKFVGRAPGSLPGKKLIGEICEELYEELKTDYEHLDEDGHRERSEGTFQHDRRYLHDEGIKRGKKPAKLRRGLIKEEFGDLLPGDITAKYWKQWWKKTGRKKYKRSAQIAKYLSHVMSFAEDQGYSDHRPTIRSFDKHTKKAVEYSPEQILTFYRNAEPDLQDLIAINSENPFRPLETPFLEWSMIRFLKERDGTDAVVVTVPGWLAKIREGRTLQVSPNAAKILLRRHRDLAKKSKYVFPAPKSLSKHVSKKTLNRMWHRMLKKAGLRGSGFLFKWLRHTLYSMLLFEHGLAEEQVGMTGGTSAATLKKHYALGNARRTKKVTHAVQYGFDKEEEE